MSAAKLVLDEELGQLADLGSPYVLLELREARSRSAILMFATHSDRYKY
jgi:hypothetical protein